MKAIAIGALMALATTTAAKAQVDKDSANYLLPGCKYSLNEGRSSGFDDADWRCPIIVGSLYATAKNERCLGMRIGSRNPLYADIPNGVTGYQAMTVVVRYIEVRPQRWHEPLRDLAIEALLDAWPCKFRL